MVVGIRLIFSTAMVELCCIWRKFWISISDYASWRITSYIWM